MNIVFVLIVTISLIMLTILNPDYALNTMVTGGKNGLMLAVTLFPIYSVWLSILRLIDSTGLNKKIERLFRPIIKKLFKNTTPQANEQIAINMTANFLGMGGAGTKAGIQAIKLMDNGYTKATDDMLMLFVLNSTSIQLLPTTLIALRGVNGSVSPSDIILPSLINTIITTTIGILLVKIFSKTTKKQVNNTK